MKMKYIYVAACLVLTSVANAKTDELGHELKAVPSNIETNFIVYSAAPTLDIKYTDLKANSKSSGTLDLATITVTYATGASTVRSLCYKPEETHSRVIDTDKDITYTLTSATGAFADAATDGLCLTKPQSTDSVNLTLSGDATLYPSGNYVLTGILYSYYK